MRCSSSERLLDAFVEGELEPAVRARVTRHVGACGNCAGILEELRVIDALLITPRRLEPAPNFTFKAMAEIRSLPLPHRHAHRLAPWPVLAAYLLFGWLAIGAFLTFGGTAAHAAVTLLTGSAAQLGAQIV